MFAKVFRTLFYGSLTGQSDAQLVFICLLTHCYRDGTVELPPNIIAALTGLPEDRVQAAIKVLEAPDERSRSKGQDGRRLEPLSFARWNVVNYLHYRAIRDQDDRKEQNRQAKQRQRQSAKVSRASSMSAHADVDAEGEADAEAKKERPTSGPSAACLSRCKTRFPNLDLLVIEAKMMAYHEKHPYRNIDMAMLNWCKKAESEGWDSARSKPKLSLEQWAAQ